MPLHITLLITFQASVMADVEWPEPSNYVIDKKIDPKHEEHKEEKKET